MIKSQIGLSRIDWLAAGFHISYTYVHIGCCDLKPEPKFRNCAAIFFEIDSCFQFESMMGFSGNFSHPPISPNSRTSPKGKSRKNGNEQHMGTDIRVPPQSTVKMDTIRSAISKNACSGKSNVSKCLGDYKEYSKRKQLKVSTNESLYLLLLAKRYGIQIC